HRSNAFQCAPMDTPRKSPVIQRGGQPAVKTPAGAGPVFSVPAWLPSGNACTLAAGSRTDPVEGERHEPEPSAHVIAACRGGNLSLLGQPPLWAFFRPFIGEPVLLSPAFRRRAPERAWPVTPREPATAPIRVKAATIARRLASSGVPSAKPPARASTSFK